MLMWARDKEEKIMGKPTGFMEYKRADAPASSPKSRIKNYNEFHEELPFEERRQQASRCMDCGVPFCQYGGMLAGMASGCPLNNLVPEWNDLLYTGNMQQAYNRLSKTNCFPEFTGRVCPALCEAACTCNITASADDKPVTSKANELSIIEYAYEHGFNAPKPPAVRTGKRVAVVGSGPSGLSTAYWLNKRGHEVTVYERSDRPGGLLMYGIPNMKLEKQYVERRINLMKAEGIKFVTGVNVGIDISADELKSSFDSVVLACGASNPRDINAEGRDAQGIYFAVDFLSRTTKSLLDSNLEDGNYISAKDKHVVVIGGGDTGNDCVGTAIRQGCASVVQLEMMPQPPLTRAESNPWPQWPRVCKTDYGQEEAIAVFGSDPRIYKTTVKEFVKDSEGRLTRLICVHLESKKDEASGRMMMVPVEGSEFELEAELVLIAAGFLGCQTYVTDAFGVELTPRTNVKTDQGTFETSVPGVFTAGDMHRGQSLVVWAIREGRDAAKAVDEKLMGYTNMV